MKRLLSLILILIVVTSSIGFSLSDSQERYIVTLSEPINDHVMEVLRANNANVLAKFNIINGFVIQSNPAGLRNALKSLNVKSIEIDQVVSILGKPTNPGKPPKEEDTSPAQTIEWGIDTINADDVWGTYTGAGIKIAVIDTGIDLSHDDLFVSGGVNIIRSVQSYNDDNGHGTHVAGIISALNNEIGVVGVAPSAEIYAVKVLDRKGSGYLSNVILGIEWSIDNGMDIINMSLGTNLYSQSLDDALDVANYSGIITVAAAGNDASDIDYPGAYANTICVGAIDIELDIAYFSSFGPEMDVIAPGVNIYSTYKGDTYKSLSGTSMATPHIAGLAALYLQNNSSGNLDSFRSFLEGSSTDLGETDFDFFYGHGLPDANLLIE